MDRSSNMRSRLAAVPQVWWVALAAVACLAPFCGSAYKVDDPLFLRAAEQIRGHPADFYGFTFNWFGKQAPMIEVFDNPPLTCCFIALVSLVAGWSEPVMHLAFVVVAALAAAGIFQLARRFCGKPLVAALAAVLTPVFLISGTTVMCDMMLLAFWVWSLHLFEKGLEKDRAVLIWTAGLLAGLAVLTKFPGLSLCPLLAAWGWIRRRQLGWWVVAPILPVIFALAYEQYTRGLYGRGLFLSAAAYAARYRSGLPTSSLNRAAFALVFPGGCFLPVLFYAPWLRMRRTALPTFVAMAVGTLLLFCAGAYRALLWRSDGGFTIGLFLQMEVFIAAAAMLLMLAALDLWEARTGDSLLLALWLAGVFVFAAVLNWTMNGRSLLPMAPVVGILLARRMERVFSESAKNSRWRVLVPTVAAAVMSLWVAQADCRIAGTDRRAAAALSARFAGPDMTLWFEGHWGFQYYMEKTGAQAVDLDHPKIRAQDLVVVPNHSPDVSAPAPGRADFVGTVRTRPGWRLATYNPGVGASFYASSMGPLPFAFGWNEADQFDVVRMH